MSIKTLEPFIDAYISQRLMIMEQKLMELNTKIEYTGKSIDLKVELY